MAATYTVKIAALALRVHPKWLDNLLSHHAVPGVNGGRQGLERSLSVEALVAIEIIRLAASELGISLARAVALASSAIRTAGRARTESGVELTFPIADIERLLHERLVEAIDAAPRPPRGRPRRYDHE